MKYRAKLVGLLSLIMLFAVPVLVSAQDTDVFGQAQKGLNDISQNSGISAKGTPESVIAPIVNTAVGVLGVAAVALIVYAGGVWITAAGNDEKVATAKKIITTTVMGMVVLGLAYSITLFIISFISS